MNFIKKIKNTVTDLRQRLIHIENKLDSIRPQDFMFANPDQRYGHLTLSQHGEDLVIVALFDQMGIDRPTYLDIGAYHPLNCSNTALLRRRGSRGVNVEANPTLMAAFEQFRPDDINLNLGIAGSPGTMTFYRFDDHSPCNTFSKEAADNFLNKHPHMKITDELTINVMTLDQIIDTYCNGRCPDFLSLDVEGLDYEILNTAKLKTRPRILCVETDCAAGQIEENMRELMSSRGFTKVIQMHTNSIFVDSAQA